MDNIPCRDVIHISQDREGIPVLLTSRHTGNLCRYDVHVGLAEEPS